MYDLHGEDFLNRLFKLDEADDLAGFDVDDPNSARAFIGRSFSDPDAAEDCKYVAKSVSIVERFLAACFQRENTLIKIA